jgi:hypothetical protein
MSYPFMFNVVEGLREARCDKHRRHQAQKGNKNGATDEHDSSDLHQMAHNKIVN